MENNKKEIKLSEKNIYKGKVVDLSIYEVMCPNGAKSYRESIHHLGGVCILAIVDEKIVMERQYRFPYDDFIYELPAGKLEKGEDPYNAAIRELEEEVGLKAESLTSYGEIYPTVAYTDEIIHLYKANNVIKTKQHLDFDESLEILYLSFDEVKEMISNGTIKDAKTIALLLKYFQSK